MFAHVLHQVVNCAHHTHTQLNSEQLLSDLAQAMTYWVARVAFINHHDRAVGRYEVSKAV